MDKALYKTAKKLMKMGDFKRAGTLFKQGGELLKAREAFSRCGEYLLAGEVSIELGQGEEAARYFLKAGRFDLLGEFYEARKNFEKAAHYYTRAGKNVKAAELYELMLKDFPSLRDIPGEIQKRSEKEIRITRLAASAQSRAGNFERAAVLYSRIGQFEDEANNRLLAGDHFAAGEAFKKGGLFDRAGTAFADGGYYLEAAKCFEKEQVHKLAAENFRKAEKYVEAGQAFERAGDFFSAAEVYSEGGEFDRAIKVLSGFTPDQEHFYKAVKRVIDFSHSKEYVTPAAKRLFSHFISLPIEKNKLSALFEIAVLLDESEYSEEARELFEKIKQFDAEAFKNLRSLSQKAKKDKPDTNTDYGRILQEDFQASEREKEYLERKSKLEKMKEELSESDVTLEADIDDTLASGTPGKKPLNFMHIQEGQKFGDRYQILQLLGSGGMGTVYKALDIELDEIVAIKILSPQLNLDENAVARFKQEIKLARKINHPNVIRIYDLGELFGIKFITMEYFEGRDLKQIINQNGFFSIPQGLELSLKICAGLQAAHLKGIIHRDIKSQNIMIADDKSVKVLDFGIAKSSNVKGLTMDGSILGTPEYISPEAILQKPVDQRSDIYSLGIVLYEIFTGSVPFTGTNIMAVIRQHLYDDPISPRSINDQLPEEIEEVILRSIDRDPESRYQSVAELKSELQMLKMVYGEDSPAIAKTKIL